MKIKPTILFYFFAFLLNGEFSYAQVVANFSATPPSGCAPLTVTFSDLSTGTPTSWSWVLGNGNTSSLQNASAVYSTPGTYTVTLVASKPGSSSTKTITVTVFGKPTANFTTSAMPSCVGQTITFTDGSIQGGGTITSWAWDFGDGNILTTLTGTATHSYTSGGTFPVSLIVTDNNGCSSSIIKFVTVLASPIAAFTGTPLSACTAPLTVNFTNTSTTSGTVSYLWKFGDGTPNSTATNPSHTYTALGSYKVTLIVTQGACIDSIVRNNYVVLQNIAADFSANTTSACIGSTINFTETSLPLSTSRIWDFGDLTPTSTLNNPTHTYATPGTYTVSLIATDASGCKDTVIKPAYITIHPLPVANFTADKTQGCDVPFIVNFTDNSTLATSWLWNFGDGSPTSSSQNPSHTYNAPGTYTVTLTVTSANGCVNTMTKTNYITITRPVANFIASPREGCAPLLVNFTSTSTSAFDPITNYSWSFGNGTATTASPTISNTYTLPGTYTVRLIITTATGCKDTIRRINHVKAGTRPTSNFNIVDSIDCYGTMSMFNDLSIGADSAFWQWGDGSTMPMLLPGPNPVTHLYADTGTYTVTLIVYNNGCADTLIQPDIVTILPPKPIFSYQLNCVNPYSVDFIDASIDADSIVWDFGDGSPLLSDSLTPTHVYTTRGLKTVTLTAYNFTTNCFFTQPASFTIADPIAQYTTIPPIGCYPLPVSFSNTSQDANISIWKFGDGSPDTIAAVPAIHTYALPGSYITKLVITDINGCMDSITSTIIVQGAIPDFISDTTTGCKPLPILFTDNSVSDSTLVQWNWSFGDLTSQTSGIPTVNHSYMSRGFYSVKMVVTDKNGCIDSITKINYIEATYPFPAFVSDSFACKGEVITFNAGTTSVTGPGIIFSWDFGDGSPAGSGVSPTHSYATDNLYTVTLTVTDKNGCDSSIQHQVRVQHPTGDFKDTTIAEGCGFRNVKFTDTSTGLYINGWNWNFGDGTSSTLQNPTHTYTVPGVYTVSLIVTNIAGCKDTITYPNLVVVPGPIGSFTFAPQTGCNPLTVIFKSNSNNTTEYIWDFGDGSPLFITTDTIVQHTYTTETLPPGANPQLLLGNIISNGSTCRLPATNLTGLVVVTTIINVDIDSTIVILPEGDFFVINSSVTNVVGTPTYSWTPSYQLSCTDCLTPSVVGDGSGDVITYHFVVTDPNGCIGYDSIKIYHILCEEELFIPNVFTPNGDGINDQFSIGGICEKDKYLLTIYDRWGIQLFSTDVKKLAWDGRSKSGQQVSDGVYYYILTHKDKTYTGFLHLMR